MTMAEINAAVAREMNSRRQHREADKFYAQLYCPRHGYEICDGPCLLCALEQDERKEQSNG